VVYSELAGASSEGEIEKGGEGALVGVTGGDEAAKLFCGKLAPMMEFAFCSTAGGSDYGEGEKRKKEKN
jgi:hypothetical protein